MPFQTRRSSVGYEKRLHFVLQGHAVPPLKDQNISHSSKADLGMSLDSKSADKELKVVTPEKSKSCVTAFKKKLVTTFQLSRTRSGHIFLK